MTRGEKFRSHTRMIEFPFTKNFLMIFFIINFVLIMCFGFSLNIFHEKLKYIIFGRVYTFKRGRKGVEVLVLNNLYWNTSIGFVFIYNIMKMSNSSDSFPLSLPLSLHHYLYLSMRFVKNSGICIELLNKIRSMGVGGKKDIKQEWTKLRPWQFKISIFLSNHL